jgi:hypothetical protein
MNRREFFATLGRIAAAGALAAVGVKVARKAGDSAAGAACRNEGWCSPCQISATCGLPRGLSFRQKRDTS